jgi:hypothetical protein
VDTAVQALDFSDISATNMGYVGTFNSSSYHGYAIGLQGILKGSAYPLAHSGYLYAAQQDNQVNSAFASGVVDIHKVSNAAFTFGGVDMMAAWDSSMTVRVDGYQGGHIVNTTTLTLNDQTLNHYRNTWTGVTDVKITIVGGVHDSQATGSGDYIAVAKLFLSA